MRLQFQAVPPQYQGQLLPIMAGGNSLLASPQRPITASFFFDHSAPLPYVPLFADDDPEIIEAALRQTRPDGLELDIHEFINIGPCIVSAEKLTPQAYHFDQAAFEEVVRNPNWQDRERLKTSLLAAKPDLSKVKGAHKKAKQHELNALDLFLSAQENLFRGNQRSAETFVNVAWDETCQAINEWKKIRDPNYAISCLLMFAYCAWCFDSREASITALNEAMELSKQFLMIEPKEEMTGAFSVYIGQLLELGADLNFLFQGPNEVTASFYLWGLRWYDNALELEDPIFFESQMQLLIKERFFKKLLRPHLRVLDVSDPL